MTQTADPWQDARKVIGAERVTLGPVASHSWLHQPDHLAMQLSRYRAASALIGSATDIVELGCGEGLGSRILIQGRATYYGLDDDVDALGVAAELYGADDIQFRRADILDFGGITLTASSWDAVVSLDVIEHIPAEREDDFMRTVTSLLYQDLGIAVIGTPSKHAEHLASPQSRAGHINLYTPDRLRTLMGRYFHTVQMLYSQDTGLHLGHPEMAHYIFGVGHGPR